MLGAGKGFDAIYAAKAGYMVTALDFSAEAINSARLLSAKEGVNIEFSGDDFLLDPPSHHRKYDLIYEYVTFCSLDPANLERAIKIIPGFLKPGGRLVSVLFPVDGREGGPPFAIDLSTFYNIAKNTMKLVYFSRNIESVKPRKGREVLLELVRKK